MTAWPRAVACRPERTLFADPDCEGDFFTLRPLTGRGSAQQKFRSALFS
ncbi:hypothetical protein AB0469_14435 [Streptomyces sp. NPDC093801]